MEGRRFEFRCEVAGQRLPPFAGEPQQSVERRTDIYLLRPARADLLPKLRARERLQVKRLLAPAGPLQYWGMPIDCEAPCDDPLMPTLLPGLPLGEGTERLIEAARGYDDYRVVEVVKERRLFILGEVRAEVAEAQIQGSGFVLRTLGFEADRADALMKLLHRSGIVDRPNRPLREAAGVTPFAKPMRGDGSSQCGEMTHDVIEHRRIKRVVELAPVIIALGPGDLGRERGHSGHG